MPSAPIGSLSVIPLHRIGILTSFFPFKSLNKWKKYLKFIPFILITDTPASSRDTGSFLFGCNSLYSFKTFSDKDGIIKDSLIPSTKITPFENKRVDFVTSNQRFKYLLSLSSISKSEIFLNRYYHLQN